MSVGPEPEHRADPEASEAHRRRIRTIFDDRAADYAREREAQPGFRRQAGWMVDAIGDAASGRLLEVGCGGGSLVETLTRRGFQHVGVDLAPAMIRNFAGRARELGAPSQAACADAEFLPFQDATFDVVLALGVMEYVSDRSRFVREAARVLRPGGRLVLSVPSSISPHALAAECFARLPARLRALLLGHEVANAGERVRRRALRLGRLRRELARAGFRPRRWRFTRFVFFPLDRLLPRFSERLATALEVLGTLPVVSRLGAQILLLAGREAGARPEAG